MFDRKQEGVFPDKPASIVPYKLELSLVVVRILGEEAVHMDVKCLYHGSRL